MSAVWQEWIVKSLLLHFRSLYLVEEGVQHADAEHLSCGERQAKHEHQVGALFPLLLWVKHTLLFWLPSKFFLLFCL